MLRSHFLENFFREQFIPREGEQELGVGRLVGDILSQQISVVKVVLGRIGACIFTRLVGCLLVVLVHEVDQLADDRLERRVLVPLRSLLLMVHVLVVL